MVMSFIDIGLCEIYCCRSFLRTPRFCKNIDSNEHNQCQHCTRLHMATELDVKLFPRYADFVKSYPPCPTCATYPIYLEHLDDVSGLCVGFITGHKGNKSIFRIISSLIEPGSQKLGSSVWKR